MAIAHDLAEYYAEAPLIVGGGTGKALALAAELAPAHPSDAAWVRAMVSSNNGHFEEAEREYAEEIRLTHDSAVSYLDLAHFLKGRKSWDRVQQTVERAMQSPQIQPADRYNASELLLRSRRNLDEAARLMRAYIQGGHLQEEAPVFRAHFVLGEILLNTGDPSQAAAEYKAALGLASSFRPAAEALRRLEKR
jgi:tetratricopeptide (TPR) repeat protein